MSHSAEDIQRLLIQAAVTELNAAFVHHLDHHQIEPLVDLFTADAIYTHGERRSEGRDALRRLFSARSAAGARTTRHLVSGLRIDILHAHAARGRSVCAAFAADGSPPLSPAVPHLVADFIDEYVCDSDQHWRIARRDIQRIFTAPSNTGPVGA